MQILVIMANTIAYLTTRSNFVQVSPEVPITKQRNSEKYDSPEVFEANKKELVTDLIVKAKQIDYLINSLPEPEPEETQVSVTVYELLALVSWGFGGGFLGWLRLQGKKFLAVGWKAKTMVRVID